MKKENKTNKFKKVTLQIITAFMLYSGLANAQMSCIELFSTKESFVVKQEDAIKKIELARNNIRTFWNDFLNKSDSIDADTKLKITADVESLLDGSIDFQNRKKLAELLLDENINQDVLKALEEIHLKDFFESSTDADVLNIGYGLYSNKNLTKIAHRLKNANLDRKKIDLLIRSGVAGSSRIYLSRGIIQSMTLSADSTGVYIRYNGQSFKIGSIRRLSSGTRLYRWVNNSVSEVRGWYSRNGNKITPSDISYYRSKSVQGAAGNGFFVSTNPYDSRQFSPNYNTRETITLPFSIDVFELNEGSFQISSNDVNALISKLTRVGFEAYGFGSSYPNWINIVNISSGLPVTVETVR